MHALRVCKHFELKKVVEYNDFHLKSDRLLLADLLENFRKVCLKIYHLGPAKFLAAAGLAWEVVLNKTEVKLGLLTDTDMLLMLEKWIGGGISHVIYRYAKANNKCMKDYENIE